MALQYIVSGHLKEKMGTSFSKDFPINSNGRWHTLYNPMPALLFNFSSVNASLYINLKQEAIISRDIVWRIA